MANERGVLLLAFLTAFLPAGAASAAGQDEPPKATFGLSLEYEGFEPIGGTVRKTVGTRSALSAIPKVDWTPADSLFLHLSLRARKDFSNEERSRLDAYESFLSVERDGWSLKSGRQFITWGRVDSLRPTDVFKRHDITDLIENREEPTDAVKLDLVRGSSTIEGVWAPVFTPDIYSLRAENQWTGLPMEADVSGVGRVGLNVLRDGTQPPAMLRSGQVGVRFSGTARGWDFAGMYYDGYDRIPTVIRRGAAGFDALAGKATITLVPIHERIRVIGGDTATVVAGWGLRGEAASTFTADPETGVAGTNAPYFRFSGGVDRTFVRLPLGESLSFIVQYALDTAPGQPGPIGQQELNPLLHPFRHALVVNNLWTFTEFKRLSVKGYVNLGEGDYVVQPEFSWQPRDSLTIAVGGDVVGGGADTFFGRFRHNDRVRVRLSYAF